jgi:hypothetical protein
MSRALHEEAGRLVQAAADTAGDRSAALYLATVTRDAEAHLTARAARPDGVAARQGPGDEAKDPRRLVEAMHMVTRGNYRGAVKEVAGYVPGPLGGVLVAARAKFGDTTRN